MRSLVNLFNEIAMLSKTPRSGFAFLGKGQQSVAEHTYIMTLIAVALSDLVSEPVNKEKLMMLCLLHDLVEARTGDLNYVNKRYVKVDLDKALEAISRSYPIGEALVDYIKEYEAGETMESKLAHDADQLELLLILKKEQDTGNPRAQDWFNIVVQRLSTDAAKTIAEEIRGTPFDEWWLQSKDDAHGVRGRDE